MSSSELDNQELPTSSSEQQLDSIFMSNYASTTSPVNSDDELTIHQVVPTAGEPSDWHPNNDYDLTLDFTTRSPYMDIDFLSLENNFSPDEPAPSEISEQQQQQIPTDVPTNLPDTTLTATHAEPPPTAECCSSTVQINGEPVDEVKKAKEPLRPYRVRIKEGKAQRHACHIEGCDKDYSRIEHLRRHLKTHSGAKPYVCDWPSCGQKFTRNETLERHKMIHSDDAGFVCDDCGKIFKRNDCLKLHAKVHERAKL